MKKFLLLTIMCVFALLGNVKAQVTTVEIGTDKNLVAGNYYLPTFDYSNYSISQQIYTEEDFNGNLGLITSVAFKLSNAGSITNRIYEVYMKHAENLDSQVAISAEDKVFDGEVAMSNIIGTWVTIPFNKAFDYAGGNVMVCVYDKTGVSAGNGYHTFYTYATDSHRARYSQSATSINVSSVNMNNCPKPYVNLVRFEMAPKPMVKAELDSIGLGEVMLGEYWPESTPFELNVKVSNTTITDLKVDNDFFVLPALEDIDFTVDPAVIEVSYDRNAASDGVETGNITMAYEDTTLVIPVAARTYTPGEADVWELAKEVAFEGNKYADTVKFTDLHDNYSLPGETANAVTPDAVYSFELKSETILRAKVEGTNAKIAIYNEDFNGKGGPSNDNNYKGNVFIDSEFFFDFNEDVLMGWTVKNTYGNDNNWELDKYWGVDNTNCIISNSYKTGATGTFLKADNYAITEKTYYITENSKLSFDAKCNNHDVFGVDHVKVEVSKDGENMIFIEEITPGDGVYETKVIDLGAKFAELGLEYSDYHVVLHHKEDNKMNVMVDNVRLSNAANVMNVVRSMAAVDAAEIYAVEYPAGKYYVVAAAESQFNFELALLNEADLPATPENLVATTIDEFSIGLSWNSADKATSYNIYRNDEFVVNVTDTTYIDENLDSDVDYCYVVKAYNDILESVASEKACAKTKKVVLTPPTEITAEATGETTIVLTWAKVEKVGGYKIYDMKSGQVVDIVSDSTLTYTVENLAPGTAYCYAVSSVYKNRESFDKSDMACATTLETETVVCDVPQNLKVVVTKDDPNYDKKYKITLTWDAVEGAEGYAVYVANQYYPDGIYMGTVTSNEYINGTDTEGELYFYVKTICNGDLGIASEPSESVLCVLAEVEFDVVAATNIENAGIIAGAGTYSQGDTVTLTATANEGYKFINWTENGEVVSEEAKYLFEITEDRNLVANFEEIEDPENPGGNDPEQPVDPEQPENPEQPGDSVVLAAPVVVADTLTETTVTLLWNVVENATSYNVYMDTELVENVTDTVYMVDGLTAETAYSFTVTAVADTLESEFSNVVTVTTLKIEEPGGDEPVDPEQPVDPENPGGNEPGEGDDNEDPENPGGNEPGDGEITCIVTAVANPEEGGSISGAGTYKKDMTVTLKATAKSGYQFLNWTENDVIVSTESEYTFTITKDINLVANFVVLEYEVIVVVNPEVAGEVKGTGTYKKNTSVTLTAIANEGYKFVSWVENGEVISETSEYSFVVTRDVELIANFVSTEGVEELASSFNIYPNPVNDKLYIETLTQTQTIEIYDIYGRLQVAEMPRCQGGFVIEVSNLTPGVYSVIIKTDDEAVVRRFVKK